MEKNFEKFLSSVLAKATLTDEQAMTIQEILFPADTPQAARQSAIDCQISYEKWNKRYEEEQARRKEARKDVKPMSEQELDELVEVM